MVSSLDQRQRKKLNPKAKSRSFADLFWASTFWTFLSWNLTGSLVGSLFGSLMGNLASSTLALSLTLIPELVTRAHAQPQTEAMRRTRIASAAALARRALQEDSVENWIRIALTTPETEVIATFFEVPIENLSRQQEAITPLRLLLSRNPEALGPALRYFSTHSSDHLALDRRTEVILAALQPFIGDARVQQLFLSQVDTFPLIVGPALVENNPAQSITGSYWSSPEVLARFAPRSSYARFLIVEELRTLRLSAGQLLQLARLLRLPTPQTQELWAAWLSAALSEPQVQSSHLLWPILWSEALQHLDRNPNLPGRVQTRTQLLRHIEAQLRTRSIALEAEALFQNDPRDEANYLEALIPDLIQMPFFVEHLTRTLEHFAPLAQWRLPLIFSLIPQLDRLPRALQEIVRTDLIRFSSTPRHRLQDFWTRLESLRHHLPPDLRRQIFPESNSASSRLNSRSAVPTPSQLQNFRELATRLRADLEATPPRQPTSSDLRLFISAFDSLRWNIPSEAAVLHDLRPFLFHPFIQSFTGLGIFHAQQARGARSSPIAPVLDQALLDANATTRLQGVPRLLRRLTEDHSLNASDLSQALIERALSSLQARAEFLDRGEQRFAARLSSPTRGSGALNSEWLAEPEDWLMRQLNRFREQEVESSRPNPPRSSSDHPPQWALDQAQAAILTEQPHLSQVDLRNPSIQREISRRAQSLSEASNRLSAQGSSRPGRRPPAGQSAPAQQRSGDSQSSTSPVPPQEFQRLDRRLSVSLVQALQAAVGTGYGVIELRPAAWNDGTWRTAIPSTFSEYEFPLSSVELPVTQSTSTDLPIVVWRGELYEIRYRDRAIPQLTQVLTQEANAVAIFSEVTQPGHSLTDETLSQRLYLANRFNSWIRRLTLTQQSLQAARRTTLRSALGELTTLSTQSENSRHITSGVITPLGVVEAALYQAPEQPRPNSQSRPSRGSSQSIGLAESWANLELEAQNLARPRAILPDPSTLSDRADPRSASENATPQRRQYRPHNTSIGELQDTLPYYELRADTRLRTRLHTRLQESRDPLAPEESAHLATARKFLRHPSSDEFTHASVVQIPAATNRGTRIDARRPIQVPPSHSRTSTSPGSLVGIALPDGSRLTGLTVTDLDGVPLQPGRDYSVIQSQTQGSYAIRLDGGEGAPSREGTPRQVPWILTQVTYQERAPSAQPLAPPPTLSRARVAALIPALRDAGFTALATSLQESIDSRPSTAGVAQSSGASQALRIPVGVLAQIFEEQARYSYRSERQLPGRMLPVLPENPFSDFIRFVGEEGRACAQCDGTNALFVEFINLASDSIDPIRAELALGLQVPRELHLHGAAQLGARDRHAVARILRVVPDGAPPPTELQSWLYDVTPRRPDPLSPRLEPTSPTQTETAQRQIRQHTGFFQRLQFFLQNKWNRLRQRAALGLRGLPSGNQAAGTQPSGSNSTEFELSIGETPQGREGSPWLGGPQNLGATRAQNTNSSMERQNLEPPSENPESLLREWRVWLRRNHSTLPRPLRDLDRTHPLRLWPKLLELNSQATPPTLEQLRSLYPEGAIPSILQRSSTTSENPRLLMAELMQREHLRFQRLLMRQMAAPSRGPGLSRRAGSARTAAPPHHDFPHLSLNTPLIVWLDRMSRSVRSQTSPDEASNLTESSTPLEVSPPETLPLECRPLSHVLRRLRVTP